MCAVRRDPLPTNLQFFPSGAVFSCGMIVEDEILSGHLWQNDQLLVRPGVTELTMTAAGSDGCPLRAHVADAYRYAYTIAWSDKQRRDKPGLGAIPGPGKAEATCSNFSFVVRYVA